MSNQELISSIEKMMNSLPDASDRSDIHREVFYVQTLQFVGTYIGRDTEFFKFLSFQIAERRADDNYGRFYAAQEVLTAIKEYLQNDLAIHETTSYKVKNDLVSDFLRQAEKLIQSKEFHPAAAAILIGASLEEFLRILIEKYGLDVDFSKGSLSVYTAELYKENIISKQDQKDITVWAGLRNEASHGKFDEVNDRKRVKLTLEGVNLFMRKMNMKILKN